MVGMLFLTTEPSQGASDELADRGSVHRSVAENVLRVGYLFRSKSLHRVVLQAEMGLVSKAQAGTFWLYSDYASTVGLPR